MSLLHQRVNEYLALRRAMGFKLREHGLLLPRFADFVEQSGAATVSVDLMLDWATQPTGVDPFRWRSRLSVVQRLRPVAACPRPRHAVAADDAAWVPVLTTHAVSALRRGGPADCLTPPRSSDIRFGR